MIRTLSFLAAVVLVLFASRAVAANVTVAGFITSIGSAAEYRINDIPVHCIAGQTETSTYVGSKKKTERVCPLYVFGEAVTVSGMKDSTGAITARLVERDKPVDLQVKGMAIIDRVLRPNENGTMLVRADGYPLLIDGKTDWDFVDLDGRKFTLADVTPNVWITYKGTLHPDGQVTVVAAGFGHNIITDSESRLRASKEFNSAEVREDDRQNKLTRAMFGVNGKRLPAYKDEAMQARIRDLGAKLVPAYQRELPESDPTKITFRFQLVDDAQLFGCFDLPSGIILVPYQVVQTLTDDAQLAEVLASGIADVLQKQALRTRTEEHILEVTRVAAIAGSAVALNPVGAATLLGYSPMNSWRGDLQRRILETATRSSLGLMHDAGYDVRAAPMAWWSLAAKQKNKPLTQTDLPYASQYLYLVLSTAWSKTTEAEAARSAVGGR